MPLRITKASEPIEVKQLVMCLYAVPGLGKTTMAFTAEAPLLLDFDKGSYRAGNRKDVVQVESWADVRQITPADLAPYKTIIVDTAGRALDLLTDFIKKDNPKLATRAGGLTLPGYGDLKATFITWLKSLRELGLDVVLVSHSEEQGKDEDLKERLDIQGGSKGEIYKSADAMGRLYIFNGKRMLNFSPTDTAFGKNPAGLPPLQVPDVSEDPKFLAGVIQQTKDALNKLSADQLEVQALMASWTERLQKAQDVDMVNALVADSQGLDKRILAQGKALLMKMAGDRGYKFDKTAKVFVAGAAS
jgi:hypothetical protein